MEREEAYKIGTRKDEFIRRLKKEGFEYNSNMSAVEYPGVNQEIAQIVQEDSIMQIFLIIHPDSEGNDEKAARQRLIDLASKF